MLALISLDAVDRVLLARLIAAGSLPNCAALMSRGRLHPIVPTQVHASVYRSLYQGVGLSAHGLHYPLQWNASRQSVEIPAGLNPEDSVFARLDRAGKRMLVIDPPECARFGLHSGIAVSGWQFSTRFVLPEWYSSERVRRELYSKFGAPRGCHEVFGRPSFTRLRATYEILLSAPRRVADAAVTLLSQQEFDCVWITFVAAHIAGHQLWGRDIHSADKGDPENRALIDVYQAIDEAIGKVLAVLPSDADIILFSPNGMGPETSRADLLPAMLTRVLDAKPNLRSEVATGSSLWRLRAALPTRLRAAVADAIPDQMAVQLAAFLENVGSGRRNARAFSLPSDGAGFIRLNLKGRERFGVVDPRDAPALLAEISAGLATFTEPSGENAITAVLQTSDLDVPGPRSASLPDLVVLWSARPVAGVDWVTSPCFGKVHRSGVGSGRSGNHQDGAWVCLISEGLPIPSVPPEPVRIIDVASTLCTRMGVLSNDLPGRCLLQ